MAANIHGFRVFQYARCSRTGLPTLQGQYGMHLHAPIQPMAECRGISQAMWMTETARERYTAKQAKKGPAVPHEGLAPDWDCTCGHYFYRTFKDAWTSDSNAYAHVTCLERTMLHTGGGRTTQYSVDYLLAPTKEGQKVFIPIRDLAQAGGYPAGYVPTHGPWVFGFYAGVEMVVERDQRELLEEISLSLGVPILEKDDLSGCPDCLVVNSWRDEKEVTDQMRRDWYGAGYRQQERDQKWKEALGG